MACSRKVCHISTVHSTFDNRVFRKECRSLAERGYEVHLVIQADRDEVVDGVHIWHLRKPKGRLDRMLRLSKEALEMARGIDADLYHFHDPELLPVGNKLKNEGKRVVFDSHEFYGLQILGKGYIPKPARGLVSGAYTAYETHVCRNIDAVVEPCTVDGVDVFAGRSNRTCFIDNLPIIDTKEPPVFQRETRDSICCTGSLTHARGTTHLIKAAYHAGVRLILCGSIDDEYHNSLRQMPEYECVEYRGFVDKDGVKQAMAESFCGASAVLNIGQYWRGDNMSTKGYEYLANGIPFIYQNSPFGQQLVKEYPFCILVNPEDIAEYAAAIMYMRDNPELASRMARVGYEALTDRFNWGHEAEKLYCLYQQLIA